MHLFDLFRRPSLLPTSLLAPETAPLPASEPAPLRPFRVRLYDGTAFELQARSLSHAVDVVAVGDLAGLPNRGVHRVVSISPVAAPPSGDGA